MPERLIHSWWYRDHLSELVVLLAVVLVVGGVFKIYQTADNVHHSLCTLRQERIQGIVDAKKFLDRHPQGIPGISRADIMRSIETQKQTVRAFRFADC